MRSRRLTRQIPDPIRGSVNYMGSELMTAAYGVGYRFEGGAIVVGAEDRADEPCGDLAPISRHELMRESLEGDVHHDVAAPCHALGNLTPSRGLGDVAAQHDCAGNELRPCDRPGHAGPLPFWTALRFP